MNKKNKKLAVCVALLALVLIGSFLLFPYVFSHAQKYTGKQGKYAQDIKSGVLYHVSRMLDGDTLIASVAGHELTVRLIGMDTPEVVDPRKPVQCYGHEASDKGKELLSGKDIYIEREENREAYDKYGRVLAYAKFPDGSLYNEYMIKEGFAREYTFNKEKYKYQVEFKKDQEEAQKEKKGLWGACPISP